jgi:glutamyl-tRNA synthetase
MSTPSAARPVRVRFAPSPTGFLHIGGVRAALFNWLYARHQGGNFLLRIEDTDLERSESRYTDDIMASLRWLGLDWDEEPLYQSKRLGLYAAIADRLIAQGHAYRCTCTEADVERMRERATTEGRKPMYDRSCRERGIGPNPGVPFVVRLKVPLDGHVQFHDLIRGDIRVENAEIDDFVLIRSNGATTYNFSCVIDDVESRMTHVIRGDDHINNTPKQLHLYRCLGYAQPEFAHLPMILGPDKKKLSKRHGAVSANQFRAEGYLPEAMLNFLVRLGWSHGDQEVFTLDEMIRHFSFDHVQKASGVWNQEKLLWLNGEHIRRANARRLAQLVADDFADRLPAPARRALVRTEIGEKLVGFMQPKVRLLAEFAEQLAPLLTPGTVEVDAAPLKWNKDPALKASTQAAIRQLLGALDERMREAAPVRREGPDAEWGASPSPADAGMAHAQLEAIFKQAGEAHGVKLGDLVQPIRLTLTGRMVSASVFDVLGALPWDVSRPRLEQALGL